MHQRPPEVKLEARRVLLDRLVLPNGYAVTTTPAKDPLIRADQVRPGTHITAMGSDDNGKQELDAGLRQKADLVVADSKP